MATKNDVMLEKSYVPFRESLMIVVTSHRAVLYPATLLTVHTNKIIIQRN